MFESLTESLSSAFRKLSGQAQLSEKNIKDGLREVRMALLEADVNYKVVKDLIKRVTEKAVGEEVIKSVQPAQQIVKVVHDELVDMLGGTADHTLPPADKRPTILMMVGLQGSGKTTSTAKLARLVKKKGRRPLLVAADVRRPAAIEQLQTLGQQLDLPVYAEPGGDPPKICADGVKAAIADSRDLVILDTGGRLHIDEELMKELDAIKASTTPDRIFFVADAMTGQDAVTSAQSFHERLGLAGVILTKMDGDARGGAALSIRAVTGAPVVYVGVGEGADALEEFHPDRIAGRILGMGDVVSLVEKASEAIDQEEAMAMQQKLMANEFTFEDMLVMMDQVSRLGPISKVMGMIPGLNQVAGQLGEVNDNAMDRPKAIIYSMTPKERRNPDGIDAQRRRRIARGSGTSINEVNQLLKSFKMQRKMMKELTGGGGVMGAMAKRQMKKLKKKGGKLF